MLGIKENVVDIPYDIITSIKLEKGLLSSTIRFKAPGLMSSTKLGMIDSIIDGQDDQGGIIEAIPKEIRRSYLGECSEFYWLLDAKVDIPWSDDLYDRAIIQII